jgi:hypothetical protein
VPIPFPLAGESWDGEATCGTVNAEFDASVQGWITHVRYADTWGLRQHVLDTPLRRP